jgi:DNA-binding NarL/FixJ family response regulator
VLLIDDRVLFREAIGQLCESDFDFDVAGQYLAFREALPCLESADVVLIRGKLLESDAEIGDIKLLVIADTLDLAESLASLRFGACGIISKDSSPDTLAAAVRHVVAGGVWYERRVIAALARQLTGASAADALDLSDRQQQVLTGIYAGLTDRAIAAKLGLTLGSVKSTVRRLRQRAGARTRSQLVRLFPFRSLVAKL